MNLFKKIIILVFITFLFVGCNSLSNKNKLDDTKPKNFNFIFNYGVNAKNQLNTINGKYTKDMINEPSIITDLVLSDEEMNSIYLEMRKINILNYPETFNPKSKTIQTPFKTYSIKIIMDDKEKDIYWKDENDSQTKDAVRLRELFEKIEAIISQKDEYKKLPETKSGYN